MTSFTLLFLIPSWVSDWRQKRKKNKEEAIAIPPAERLTDTFLKEDERKTDRAIRLLYAVHGKKYVESLSEKDFKEVLEDTRNMLDGKSKELPG